MGKNKIQQGYTLIEVLVSTLIFVLVVGIGIATFAASGGFQSKTRVMRDTNQAARYALDTITKDVRMADGVKVYTSIANEQSNLIGTNVAVKGFAFLGLIMNSQLDTSLDISKKNKLAIFKKMSGNCEGVTQEIIYEFTNQQILQTTDYSLPLPPECKVAKANANLLPDSVEVEMNNSGFYGEYPRECADPTVDTDYCNIKKEPYSTINIQVQTKDYDSREKGEEKSVIKLETTVVPRMN